MIAPKNILVATDFSAPSDAALLYGRSFARAYGGRLHVIHVVDDLASRASELTGALPNIVETQQQLEAESRTRLNKLLDDEDRRDLRAAAVVIVSNSAAHAILRYADDERIDLIVVGTHGRSGFARFFMGSVAQHVVRLAPCPVLTVRAPEREFVQPDALQVVENLPDRPAGRS